MIRTRHSIYARFFAMFFLLGIAVALCAGTFILSKSPRPADMPAGGPASGGPSTVGSLVASALVAGIFSGAVGLGVAHTVVGPVTRLTRVARSLASGNLDLPEVIPGSDEITLLSLAIRDAAAGLKRVVDHASRDRRQMEAALSTMRSGVVVVDGAGRIVLLNQAAARMFGVRPPFLGRPHVETLRNYQMSAAIDRAIASRQPARTEVRVIYPEEKSLEVLLNPISGELDGHGVVVALHDVTELKRLETVRKDFVANVSHELRTPVTSVRGFAETLLDGALDDPAAAREFVETIYREASRLDRLARDLADLSEIESAPSPVTAEPGDLRAPVEESVRKASHRAASAGIVLRSMLPDTPVLCRFDSTRIEQVMDNLLENAIKFTSRGGSIDVSMAPADGFARVTVRDTGTGIPPQDLPRIFERFYTVDKARSRKLGGTGLGLSIVKHLVDLHGGKAWAESEYGKGSAFHFTIPLLTES
ncbi:MAG: ATP-binding protein [Ignavibacteriales bacterium]